MRAFDRAAAASFLLVCAWASHASAEFKLAPSLSIREEYNDNIELTRDNRKDDFITTIGPSLGISWKTSMLELSADYGVNFRFYLKNSDRNETDYSGAQRAKADTTITLLPERLFLKVSDVFERVPIDERDQVALDNYFVNMTNTNRLTVNPYLQYPLTSTIFLNAGYTYTNIWYDDPAGDDSESHSVTGGLTKQFGERLSIFGNYSHKWEMPKNTPKYESRTATIGAFSQVTPKLRVSGSVGGTESDYGDIQGFKIKRIVRLPDGTFLVLFEPVRMDRKTSSVIWNVQATYALSERISLALGWSQSVQDSVYQGSTRNRTYNGSLSYDAKIPLTLSANYTEATYLLIDRKDKTLGGTISTSIPLFPSIILRLSGTYNHHTFQPDGEKVDRYGVSAGFDYELSFTTIGVGYTYNNSNSSINENDYYNNIAFVQARFTF